MASAKLMSLILLISCICLQNVIQTSDAAAAGSENNLETKINKHVPPFNWVDQKTWTPTLVDPTKCMGSFSKASVCLTDFWTNLGKPSSACCQALKDIDASCLSALMPLLNPFIGQFLDGACNFASGGGTGGFPFPPFPFQLPGVGSTPPPPPPSP